MPTVMRWGRYRVFFYSNEGGEPPHVHVRAGNREVKIWLEDLTIAVNFRFPAHELGDIIRELEAHREVILEAWIEKLSWKHGMTTLEIEIGDLHAVSVEFTPTDLVVTLADGRKIVTPIEWYPRLSRASTADRANYEIMPMGIHWPTLDEDLSIAGMLKGRRSST